MRLPFDGEAKRWPHKMREHSVRFFVNTCPSCINDVAIPLLGDFAYGTLVFQTDDGKRFAFAEVIAEEAWDTVARICESEFGLDPKRLSPELTIFQHVAIRCADTLGGKNYTTHFPLCPLCGARISSYGDNVTAHDGRIPFATWHNFMALTAKQRNDLVIKLWKEESGQQTNALYQSGSAHFGK